MMPRSFMLRRPGASKLAGSREANRRPAACGRHYEAIMHESKPRPRSAPTHRAGWFQDGTFKLFSESYGADCGQQSAVTRWGGLPDFSEFQDYGFGTGAFPLAIRIVDRHPEWAPLKRDGTAVAALPSNDWLDPKLGVQIRDVISEVLSLDPAVVTPSSLMVADHRLG